MPLETEASLKEVVDKAEQIGTDLQIKKEALATAITSKKVPTNATDSLQVMKDNIDSIKTKLPILEGDVGVAEDTEGNVYGVTEIAERFIYESVNQKDGYELWTQTLDTTYSRFSIVNNNIVITAGSLTTTNKISEFTRSGDLIRVITTPDVGIPFFSKNFIYLFSNLKVQKFTYDWEQIFEITLNLKVVDFKVDSLDNIYVTQESKLLKYNSEGSLDWEIVIKKYGTYFVIDENDFVYVISRTGDSINTGSSDLQKIDSLGNELWKNTPRDKYNFHGIQIDSFNNIYVTQYQDVTYQSELYKIDKENGSKLVEVGGRTISHFVLDNKTDFTYSFDNATGGGFNNAGTISKNYKLGTWIVGPMKNRYAKTVYVDPSTDEIFLLLDGGFLTKVQNNAFIEKVAVLKESEVQ